MAIISFVRFKQNQGNHMFNTTSISRFWSQYGMFVLALGFMIVLLAMPHVAHATTDGQGQDLPFEGPLKKLKDSISGPVAFSISLIGIIAAGAVLIFGGEMSGFIRTMVFLVLVIAIITNASGIMKIMSGDGALIAGNAMRHFQSAILSVRGIG
jgi:type IV secretory pathway VirB2 component (pilin)